MTIYGTVSYTASVQYRGSVTGCNKKRTGLNVMDRHADAKFRVIAQKDDSYHKKKTRPTKRSVDRDGS